MLGSSTDQPGHVCDPDVMLETLVVGPLQQEEADMVRTGMSKR